jgi:hypothetical protein
MWSFMPSNVENIPKVSGGYHSYFGAVMFQRDICCDGRAMNDQLNFIRSDSSTVTQLR